jgi:large subunit ribosomal protein L34
MSTISLIYYITKRRNFKMRRTLEGTKIKRQRVSGFRARMSTPGGQEVLNRRRAKGRHKLAVTGSKRA